MYLISIYFDEKCNKTIQQYIDSVSKRTGNHYMLEGKVPPHITISAFEMEDEKEAIEVLERVSKKIGTGKITWASVGQFFPYVLFVQPVLNKYLHDLSLVVAEELSELQNVKVRSCYEPFQWIPHTTVGKKLNKEEMKEGFEVLQNSFGMFHGTVVSIGLAKTNPYQDIQTIMLNKEEGKII